MTQKDTHSHAGHRQRLRDRYIKNGLSGFADHELLELLLTYAIPRQDTNELSHALIHHFGSLGAVLLAAPPELMTITGVGESAAIFLALQGELMRDISLRTKTAERKSISTPMLAAGYALDLLEKEHYESVYVVSLDKNLRLLNAERVATGTLTEAPLYPRRVVETALHHHAHAVMLLHNHPSGNPTPSEDDIRSTQSVKGALNSIDILLFDHLVVGQGSVYSCARNIFINREGNVSEGPAAFASSTFAPPQDELARMAAEKKSIN